MGSPGRPEELTVALQDVGVGLRAELLDELGRTLDIAEQEGQRAARQARLRRIRAGFAGGLIGGHLIGSGLVAARPNGTYSATVQRIRWQNAADRGIARQAEWADGTMADEDQIADELAGFALFADLSTPQLQGVAHAFEESLFQDGERVLRQGMSGGGFFLIMDGEASVRVDGEERARLGRASSSARSRSCSASRRWPTSWPSARCAASSWPARPFTSSCWPIPP